MATELIRLENLVKVYDTGALKVLGLNQINLSIHQGEFVAIMGHSGSGKSTLLNILGCLDHPSLGNYYLDGQNVSYLKPNELSRIRNQKIGFVFQSFNLISRMSILKNVEVPMIYAGKKAAERQIRAKSLLEMVGLGARIHHQPNELSGGQRQRVAIARALANNPPASGGRAHRQSGFSGLHRNYGAVCIAAQPGVTVVVVTHEDNIAAYTNRIIRFQDGQIWSDAQNPTPTPIGKNAGLKSRLS